MKKQLVLILILICIVSPSYQIFAQQSRWQNVGRSTNGSISYLDTSGGQKSGNERRAWTKDLYPDGSYKMSIVTWQCRERKFRMRQTINYDATGKAISTEKDIGWLTVVPDTVSEAYYKAVCRNSTAEQTTGGDFYSRNNQTLVQIIVLNANLRQSPTIDSPVIEKIAKGAYLILVDLEPNAGWYQVFIPDTNETGWLHESTIEFVEPAGKPKHKKQKPRKQITNKYFNYL